MAERYSPGGHWAALERARLAEFHRLIADFNASTSTAEKRQILEVGQASEHPANRAIFDELRRQWEAIPDAPVGGEA